MTSSSPVLRVRVNYIDHILVDPGPLDNSSQHLVPIIRVYGISSIGKKTCVHIHQVYPYFYIEYTGKVDPESGMLSLLIPVSTLRTKHTFLLQWEVIWLN